MRAPTRLFPFSIQLPGLLMLPPLLCLFDLPTLMVFPIFGQQESVQIEFDLLKFDIFRDTSAANQANMSKKKCTEGKCCIISLDLSLTLKGSHHKKTCGV